MIVSPLLGLALYLHNTQHAYTCTIPVDPLHVGGIDMGAGLPETKLV